MAHLLLSLAVLHSLVPEIPSVCSNQFGGSMGMAASCVAQSSEPVVHHPNQIVKTRNSFLIRHDMFKPPRRKNPKRVTKNEQQIKVIKKFPTVFAKGREGALLPVIPLNKLGSIVRKTCDHWAAVNGTITCVRWQISHVSTLTVKSDKIGPHGPAKPWPPVLFPNEAESIESQSMFLGNSL